MKGLLPIILQVISGAIGGYLAGKAKKEISLGKIGDTVAGLLGGVGLGQLLPMVLPMLNGAGGSTGTPELGEIIGSVGGGGVGGAVLTGVVGLIKRAMTKK